jgi:hypothetical protein
MRSLSCGSCSSDTAGIGYRQLASSTLSHMCLLHTTCSTRMNLCMLLASSNLTRLCMLHGSSTLTRLWQQKHGSVFSC